MSEERKKISELYQIPNFTGLEWFEVIQPDGAGGWRTFRMQTAELRGRPGEVGPEGLSAYQLAVEAGYPGTITQWLESLKGHNAYQLAVINGFTGSVAEWLETLKGPQGDPGDPVQLQLVEDNVSWKYVGQESWTPLINIDDWRKESPTVVYSPDIFRSNGSLQVFVMTQDTALSLYIPDGYSMVLHIRAGDQFMLDWPPLKWVGSPKPILSAENVFTVWNVGGNNYITHVGQAVDG